MAYIMIKGSDYPRYGSLLRGFGAQFSLGLDQYPKDLITATDVMTNHKFDPKYFKNREAHKKAQAKHKPEPKSDDKGPKEASFAQTEADCHACGKTGHIARDCKNKPASYKDWYVNKAMRSMKKSMAQTPMASLQESDDPNESETDDDESVRSTTSSRRRSGTPARSTQRTQYRNKWSAFQQECEACECDWIDETGISHKQTHEAQPNLKNVIILDTGSTIEGTFMNPDLVHNIKPSKRPIGMQTNAGTKRLSVISQVPGFGSVWYNPTNMANIFGFSAIKDKVKSIKYNSAVKDAFIVTNGNNEIVKFTRTKEGLYAYKPTDKYIKKVACLKGSLPPTSCDIHRDSQWPHDTRVSFMISSVRENMLGYTPQQLKGAKAARKLYRTIGSPTVENYKSILKQNLIEECPVWCSGQTLACSKARW